MDETLKLLIESGVNLSGLGEKLVRYYYFKTITDVILVMFLILCVTIGIRFFIKDFNRDE